MIATPVALVLALASGLAWAFLIFARGGFWRADVNDDAADAMAGDRPLDTAAASAEPPSVVAVIPARNEADCIADTLKSVSRQDYPGSLRIVVVDDHSTDGTGDIARRVAGELADERRIDVVAARDLAAGWTGKLWALREGVAFAAGADPAAAYLWFTDADIRYANDTLSRSIARARAGGLVMVSYMACLRARSLVERALVPAFVFFFQMLYPFRWVNDPRRAIAAAAGGCVLVQRESLEAAGGVAAIRGELIDDCALARRMKARGPIWLGLSTRVVSVRAYETWAEVRQMIARCAYAQLRYSPRLLALAVLGMAVTYIAPVALALFADGVPRLAGIGVWAAMALAFLPTLRRFGLAPLWGIALPFIALTYLCLTLDSALQYCRGAGGMWKGRPQAGRQGEGAGN